MLRVLNIYSGILQKQIISQYTQMPIEFYLTYFVTLPFCHIHYGFILIIV